MIDQIFSDKTIRFINDLKNNNNKLWFETHKNDYQKYLLDPFRQLAAELSAPMLSLDPYLEVTPAINKTISRIYRDTRFSKDKSLYRPNMWLTYKRSKENWRSAPAYFFEITPDLYRYGMGFYGATPTYMRQLREEMDNNPDEFEKAISFFNNQNLFMLKGDNYKRMENKYSPKIQQWYQKKFFYLVCTRDIDDFLFSNDLINELIHGFNKMAPLYFYLLKVSQLG